MYKSSKTYVYFYKYGGIIPAILSFIVWLQALFFDPNISAEDPGDISFYFFTIMIFSVIAISLFVWIKIGLKLCYVEMNDESITLFKSNKTITYKWDQIEYIKKIIFTIPVSYKFKIRGNEDFFITCSTPLLPAPFHIPDSTPFGNFIKIKKKQNNI
ncbi:MAG TPA: hypothetical protein PKN32_03455 [Bacteroidales bacterium]|nr:hypothetical protein [Bacteroidales bacterium]